jgi:hypothetical protein
MVFLLGSVRVSVMICRANRVRLQSMLESLQSCVTPTIVSHSSMIGSDSVALQFGERVADDL